MLRCSSDWGEGLRPGTMDMAMDVESGTDEAKEEVECLSEPETLSECRSEEGNKDSPHARKAKLEYWKKQSTVLHGCSSSSSGQQILSMLDRARILEHHFDSTESLPRLTTRDPEIAAMLQGEDEWLDELVQRSVPFATEVPSSKMSCRDPEIAAVLQGEDEWLQEFGSRSILTGPAVDGGERGRKTKEDRKKESDERRRQRLLCQESTFGRCPKHGCMLGPHLLRSGTLRGELVLYCARWFHFREAKEKRCWHREVFNMDLWRHLPQNIKDDYQSLSSSLARGSRA